MWLIPVLLLAMLSGCAQCNRGGSHVFGGFFCLAIGAFAFWIGAKLATGTSLEKASYLFFGIGVLFIICG